MQAGIGVVLTENMPAYSYICKGALSLTTPSSFASP